MRVREGHVQATRGGRLLGGRAKQTVRIAEDGGEEGTWNRARSFVRNRLLCGWESVIWEEKLNDAETLCYFCYFWRTGK